MILVSGRRAASVGQWRRQTVSFAVVLFTACILLVGVALPVAAQKPLQASKRSAPKPSSSPIIVINNLPAPPPSASPSKPPKFIWWKDFPWTALAGLLAAAGAITAALIARNTAERRRKSDENASDRKLLQDQFGDIQNRLASPEPIIRANAALRLAQFGETLKPGLAEGYTRTKENNPYFIPVVSQLATALYIEPDPVIRKAIREALKSLIAFATNEEVAQKYPRGIFKQSTKIKMGDQRLLYALIERLIDANHTARDEFIRAFAEWSVTNEDWRKFDRLESEERDPYFLISHSAVEHQLHESWTSIAPFCKKKRERMAVFAAVVSWGQLDADANGGVEQESLFVKHREKYALKRAVQADGTEGAKADALLLPLLDTKFQQLVDTRDVLALALQALPQTETDEMDDELDAPDSWTPVRRRLNLKDCFLCGADLSDANLQGMDLSDVNLQGVNLFGAYLDRSLFYRAHLEGADLRRARLDHAVFVEAHLEEADLSHARLAKAEFYRAHLEDALLIRAHLEDADLFAADLRGTVLNGASLKGANLYGVFVLEHVFAQEKGKNITFIRCQLPSNTLDVANFEANRFHEESPEADARTESVKAWLVKQREAEQKGAAGAGASVGNEE